MELSKRIRFNIAKHPEFYGTLSEDEKGDWVIVPFEDAEMHDKLSAAKDAVVEAASKVMMPISTKSHMDAAGKLRRTLNKLNNLKAVQDVK